MSAVLWIEIIVTVQSGSRVDALLELSASVLLLGVTGSPRHFGGEERERDELLQAPAGRLQRE